MSRPKLPTARRCAHGRCSPRSAARPPAWASCWLLASASRTAWSSPVAGAMSAERARALLGAWRRRRWALGPFAVRSSGIAEDGAERSFAGMYESVLDVPADELAAAADRTPRQRQRRAVAAYRGRQRRRPPHGGDHPADGRSRPRPAWLSPPTRSTATGARASSPPSAASASGWSPARPSATSGSSRKGRDSPTPARAGDRSPPGDRGRDRGAPIADARGRPQDIEWAIDADGTLWILQARPMTALPPEVSWDAPAPGAFTRRSGSASGSPSR